MLVRSNVKKFNALIVNRWDILIYMIIKKSLWFLKIDSQFNCIISSLKRTITLISESTFIQLSYICDIHKKQLQKKTPNYKQIDSYHTYCTTRDSSAANLVNFFLDKIKTLLTQKSLNKTEVIQKNIIDLTVLWDFF